MNSLVLAILGILFGIQLLAPKARLNRFGLFGISAFISATVLIFGLAGYLSWRQYLAWENNSLTKLLLPPYQSWDYFVFYVRVRFFNPYLLSLFFGTIFLQTAKKMNKKYGERFFEPIEPYFLATAIFLVGHPAWIFYLIILLAVFLAINFSLSIFSAGGGSAFGGNFLLNKEMPRVSLWYLWLPAAIFTILINGRLITLPWWQILKF